MTYGFGLYRRNKFFYSLSLIPRTLEEGTQLKYLISDKVRFKKKKNLNLLLILCALQDGEMRYMVILLMKIPESIFLLEKDKTHLQPLQQWFSTDCIQNHQGIFKNRNRDTQYSPGNSDLVGFG